ncbi:MAG: hypothetical protein PHV17_01490 [Candidatus Omnitrophica bacterium]|nr:hypothetical protein [Candidatus Omnitrophota bacterium]
MRYDLYKIFFSLLILLLLDILKPLTYSLHGEFLIVGIIFVFIYYPARISLPLGIFFSYCKDAISINVIPINVIEIVFIFFLIKFLLYRLPKSAVRIFLPVIALAAYVLINCFHFGVLSFMFNFRFLVNSYILFLISDYLLRKNLKVENPYISDYRIIK